MSAKHEAERSKDSSLYHTNRGHKCHNHKCEARDQAEQGVFVQIGVIDQLAFRMIYPEIQGKTVHKKKSAKRLGIALLQVRAPYTTLNSKS